MLEPSIAAGPISETIDVLIAGGGPAGLATAAAAAAGGRSVLVVHRDAEIGQPVRTSGGSWKQHLDQLELPAHLYQPIDTLEFAGPSVRHRFSFGDDHPVVLDVTGTYRYLAERARAAGAEIRCGTEFSGLQQAAGGGWHCRIKSRDGSTNIHARHVVDATGHRRVVLSSLGLATPPKRVGVGVEYEFENQRPDDHTATLFVGTEFAPSGYGWIFPTNKNTVRVGVGIIRPDTKASAADLLDRFLNSPSAGSLPLATGRLVDKHFGVIPSDGVIAKFAHEAITAVGDSIGIALPLVGEGIRYCIEAGRKLGEGLAAQPLNLVQEPYEQWWRENYERSFKLAQRINEHISGFNDLRWREAVQMIGKFDASDLARLLRMELDLRLGRLLVRRGGLAMIHVLIRSLFHGSR